MTADKSNVLNIVHEADSQRQHVRVQIPALVHIDGQSYDVKEWSVAGLALECKTEAELARFKEQGLHSAELSYDLSAFKLNVPINLEVMRVDNQNSMVGARFSNMEQAQLSTIQNLVNAYISGELVSAGDAIHVVSRNNFVKPRTIPTKGEESGADKSKKLFKKISLYLVFALAVLYVLSGLYEQIYLITAKSALVVSNGFALQAPAGGALNYNDIFSGDTVKKGDVIMNVVSGTGTIQGIDSPCDCVVSQIHVPPGTTVSKGESILALSPVGTRPYVDAFVTYEEAARLAEGQTAHVLFFGAKKTQAGTIIDIVSKAEASETYIVRIKFEKAIPQKLIGTPVKVKFDTLGMFNAYKQ